MANFFIYLIIFIWGASIGSFLNVVIYRLPAKISLINPPSRCPKCLHPLGITENIPVFGWLWLAGKCRWCHTSISPRYPLIEAITGFLFVLIFHQFGFTWLTLGYSILLSWLIALAMIDFDTMTLPNSLTQSGLIIGLGWQTWLGFTIGGINSALQYLFISIFSTVIGIWLFDIIRVLGTIIFGKPAMGGGDPKLTAMIGSWLGWQGVLLTGFLACLLGTIFGVCAIVFKLLKKGQPMPFGPFLVLGAISTMFWGDRILSTYLEYML
ncbi:A24 family peptidase [Geminocystis sp. NIES-3709]|uniref:prepilin peptidase n=1 Tax=Geminocystis sp. NIES-3709 TaxID=1617448 RepID=UPI0005FCA3FE|nr:A24 family peptidase [Geminocystis sp. NIES-3709]BAQ63554.1 leader peptidase [Geminocystis sp. NIES-3709]